MNKYTKGHVEIEPLRSVLCVTFPPGCLPHVGRAAVLAWWAAAPGMSDHSAAGGAPAWAILALPPTLGEAAAPHLLYRYLAWCGVSWDTQFTRGVGNALPVLGPDRRGARQIALSQMQCSL